MFGFQIANELVKPADDKMSSILADRDKNIRPISHFRTLRCEQDISDRMGNY